MTETDFSSAAQFIENCIKKDSVLLDSAGENIVLIEKLLGEETPELKKAFDELVLTFRLMEKIGAFLRDAEQLSSLAECRAENIRQNAAAGCVRLRYAELDYLKKLMKDIVFS